jgi:hypothetical protein
MASEQRLKELARALGFFPGAVLLGALVCTGTASAQCGATWPISVKNTACGTAALATVTTGARDSAFGHYALYSNTSGEDNTAIGTGALRNNTMGGDNTASGSGALYHNTTGHDNIGLGYYAGGNIVTGSNNIDIGNGGAGDESNTIRIGIDGKQSATYIAGISGSGVSSPNVVCVTDRGQLGVCSSSARYKRDIRDMGAASGGLMRLRPVVFRYRSDPKSQQQYGLIAEEVARVYPELVDYDHEGKPLTVRYLELNSMLLNEVQKQDGELQKQADELRQRAAESHQQAEQILSLSAQVRAHEQKIAELQVNHERELRTLEASFEQRLSALEQTNHREMVHPVTLMR